MGTATPKIVPTNIKVQFLESLRATNGKLTLPIKKITIPGITSFGTFTLLRRPNSIAPAAVPNMSPDTAPTTADLTRSDP